MVLDVGHVPRTSRPKSRVVLVLYQNLYRHPRSTVLRTNESVNREGPRPWEEEETTVEHRGPWSNRTPLTEKHLPGQCPLKILTVGPPEHDYPRGWNRDGLRRDPFRPLRPVNRVW